MKPALAAVARPTVKAAERISDRTIVFSSLVAPPFPAGSEPCGDEARLNAQNDANRERAPDHRTVRCVIRMTGGISISLRVTVSKGPMQRRQSNHRSKESPDRPGVRRRPIETVALLLEVTWEHHPTRIKDEPYTPGNPPKLGM
jgi:hypothetical protein